MNIDQAFAHFLLYKAAFPPILLKFSASQLQNKGTLGSTVNVDCVKFEYVVLAKYHHMLIFEFDLLTKQHILILCKKLL